MSSNEWSNLHQDVRVLMQTDRVALTLMIKMEDRSNTENKVERVMPFQSLPLEQGELVLEDYLCSIYEQLYQQIKTMRSEQEQ